VRASEKILLGLVGCGGMGSNDLYAMMETGMVEVVAVCDVDDSHSARVAKEVARRQGKAPKVEKDFRSLIANRQIDAVIVGTPDHWHALVTIYACRAGKDVYVEKPLSHEVAEGLAMIKAARENRRVVQLGTQLRSTEHMKTAVDYGGWKAYCEPKGEVVAEQSGSLNHAAHVRNFLECVKSRKRPNADVETGYRTTSWCLLGIIAQSLGRKVHFDARRQRFIGDDEANRMLSRPYRAPWRLPA